VLQTYLWLRHEGYDVSIAPTLPDTGIVVLLPEAESRAHFRRQYQPAHRSLFVLTIRADVYGYRSPIGDADIVQNGAFADNQRTFFVPHWPQPGLQSRNPGRGDRIEHIVFKGGYGSLHADYRSESWLQFLDERGLTFEVASAQTNGTIPPWHDYRTADLCLAVRPPHNDGGRHYDKPASKLVNAWHAGVPALLGPEYAYQELRQSPLDYVEVHSLSDTMTTIDRLRADRARYRALRERCRERAQEFTPTRIAERWAEVLFDRIPQIVERPSYRLSRPLPLPLRQLTNLVTMPPAPFELRKQVGALVRSTRHRLHGAD
jgi:hypothetical protein